MIKQLLFHPHTGLGDQIICNGMTRHFINQYDFVHLVVKAHTYEPVSFMYRDVPNITYIIEGYLKNFLYKEKDWDKLIIRLIDSDTQYASFDKAFYDRANLDFSLRWSNFHIERDYVREKEIFSTFNIEEGKYIFVHDDKRRNFYITDDVVYKNSNVDKGLPIIRPDDYSFFDYPYLIENAAEIHCMESSFRCLIDHLDIKTNSFFYHNYVRNYPKEIRAASKFQWAEIN